MDQVQTCQQLKLSKWQLKQKLQPLNLSQEAVELQDKNVLKIALWKERTLSTFTKIEKLRLMVENQLNVLRSSTDS